MCSWPCSYLPWDAVLRSHSRNDRLRGAKRVSGGGPGDPAQQAPGSASVWVGGTQPGPQPGPIASHPGHGTHALPDTQLPATAAIGQVKRKTKILFSASGHVLVVPLPSSRKAILDTGAAETEEPHANRGPAALLHSLGTPAGSVPRGVRVLGGHLESPLRQCRADSPLKSRFSRFVTLLPGPHDEAARSAASSKRLEAEARPGRRSARTARCPSRRLRAAETRGSEAHQAPAGMETQRSITEQVLVGQWPLETSRFLPRFK